MSDELEWENDILEMTREELIAEVKMVRELAKENYAKAESAYARGLEDGAAKLDHEIPPAPAIGKTLEEARANCDKYLDPEYSLDDILGFLERRHKMEMTAYHSTVKKKDEGWCAKWSERTLRIRDINNRIHEVGCILGFVRSVISLHRRKATK